MAVTTDVMVGFGETGKEFETYRFLEDLRLYNMHVLSIPQKSTPAAASFRPGKRKG